MILGILKEPASESRVAMSPDSIAALQKLKIEKILVEPGAGNSCGSFSQAHSKGFDGNADFADLSGDGTDFFSANGEPF